MQRFNFEKKKFRQHQRRRGHNWTSSKQIRKNQFFSMILEEERGEDSTFIEGERSKNHMDMMGHVIHILHTFFILVS
jgi:hypothetical protein